MLSRNSRRQSRDRKQFFKIRMRLLEAIVEANQRANSPAEVQFDSSPYTENSPSIALTYIDPRLNRLFPHALGIPEDQFICVHHAGNIIFDPLSAVARPLGADPK